MGSMVSSMVVGRKVVKPKIQSARQIANVVHIKEMVKVIIGCRV